MLYTTDNLYFNHLTKWVKLINEDLKNTKYRTTYI